MKRVLTLLVVLIVSWLTLLPTASAEVPRAKACTPASTTLLFTKDPEAQRRPSAADLSQRPTTSSPTTPSTVGRPS